MDRSRGGGALLKSWKEERIYERGWRYIVTDW